MSEENVEITSTSTMNVEAAPVENDVAEAVVVNNANKEFLEPINPNDSIVSQNEVLVFMSGVFYVKIDTILVKLRIVVMLAINLWQLLLCTERLQSPLKKASLRSVRQDDEHVRIFLVRFLL